MPKAGEYEYLLKILKDLGYKRTSARGMTRDDGFIFDLFPGKSVHTTELLESPLNSGNNIPIRELTHVYLGVLNYYDIIISKLFRGTTVDMDDCLMLIRAKRNEIDIKKLIGRFNETAAYDVSEDKVRKNLEHFIRLIDKENLRYEK